MRLPLTSPHRPIFHQNVIMILIIQGNIIENTLYHFGTSAAVAERMRRVGAFMLGNGIATTLAVLVCCSPFIYPFDPK